MSEYLSNAGEIIAQVLATAEPEVLTPGTVYLVTDGDGERHVIDTDGYNDVPRRTVRSIEAHDVAALTSYVNTHAGTSGAEVWADQNLARIVAIIDPPQFDMPDWTEHRATYQLRVTPEWEQWLKSSGALMGQTEFAEMIEDRAAEIVTPEPAVMLELAQSFNATGKVDFESASYLADGRRALEYRETIEARAGRTGQLTIPATFDLGLRPWWGCDPYRVTARMRYRIDGGNLRIGYKLVSPERVLEQAFGDVVEAVVAGLDNSSAVRLGRP